MFNKNKYIRNCCGSYVEKDLRRSGSRFTLLYCRNLLLLFLVHYFIKQLTFTSLLYIMFYLFIFSCFNIDNFYMLIDDTISYLFIFYLLLCAWRASKSMMCDSLSERLKLYQHSVSDQLITLYAFVFIIVNNPHFWIISHTSIKPRISKFLAQSS